MKQLNFRSFLYVSALALATTSSLHAASEFWEAGTISKLNGGSMTLSDTNYRISPTVEVFDENGKKALLINLASGDSVDAKIVRLPSGPIVDEIWLLNE